MLSNQDNNSDAFVAAVEVAVRTKFGAALDGIARILLEYIPFFTKNDARDESFFLTPKKGLAESSAKRATFSGRAVAVDDFESNHSGLSGLMEFGEETLASFFYGGQTGFNVKSPESVHGQTEKLCPRK